MTLDGSRLVVGGYDYADPSQYRVWFHRLAADSGAPDPSFNGGTARVLDLDGGGTASEYVNAIGRSRRHDRRLGDERQPRPRRAADRRRRAGRHVRDRRRQCARRARIRGPRRSGAARADRRREDRHRDRHRRHHRVVGPRRPDHRRGRARRRLRRRRLTHAARGRLDQRHAVLARARRRRQGGPRWRHRLRLGARRAARPADGRRRRRRRVRPRRPRPAGPSRRGAADSISRLHVRGGELFAIGVRRASGDVRETFVAAFGEPRPPAAAAPGPAPRPARGEGQQQDHPAAGQAAAATQRAEDDPRNRQRRPAAPCGACRSRSVASSPGAAPG